MSSAHRTHRAAALRNAALVALAGFLALVLAGWVMGSLASAALDRGHLWWLEDGLAGRGGPALRRIMHYGSILGTVRTSAIIVAAATLVAIVVVPRRAMLLPIAFGGGLALVQILKVLVHRPCPPAGMTCGPSAAGGSFPSGHAFDATIVFGALVLVLAWGAPRLVQLLLAAGCGGVALLVGTSRAWFGLHWMSDVVAGWLLAAGWLAVLAWAYAVSRGASPACRLARTKTAAV